MGLREDIWHDTLSQVEIRKPVVVAPAMTVHQAIEAMQQASVGYVLVCEGAVLQGIFTERDLIKRVLNKGENLEGPVGVYMTTKPVTTRMSETVGAVIRVMHQGHYRHLPVVDDQGKPIGVVSVKRIVQYLVDHFPSVVYNLPPDPRQIQVNREGA